MAGRMCADAWVYGNHMDDHGEKSAICRAGIVSHPYKTLRCNRFRGADIFYRGYPGSVPVRIGKTKDISSVWAFGK